MIPELLAILAKQEKQLQALNYHPTSSCDKVASCLLSMLSTSIDFNSTTFSCKFYFRYKFILIITGCPHHNPAAHYWEEVSISGM